MLPPNTLHENGLKVALALNSQAACALLLLCRFRGVLTARTGHRYRETPPENATNECNNTMVVRAAHIALWIPVIVGVPTYPDGQESSFHFPDQLIYISRAFSAL